MGFGILINKEIENTLKLTLVIIIIVVLVLVGVLYWYLAVRQVETEKVEEILPAGVGVVEIEEEADLGSEIFDKVTNPIEGKIPEAGTTVPNPLEGVYENPFGS